jgi:hypothetical protein
MGSTISIVLAVVAVVVGFLILKNITDDGSSASDGGDVPIASLPENSVTANTALENTTTSTTTPPLVTAGATVVVANASGVPGSAGRMTTELTGLGFAMAEATNSTQTGLVASIVHYDPSIAAALAVAESVARSMGGIAVEVVPTPPPVDGGSLNGAGVLVLLGTDQADKTIAQMTAAVATPAAPAAAPDVSGSTPTDSTAATTG